MAKVPSKGRTLAFITAGISLISGPHSVEATEAAMGRFIPGLFAGPGAGIVPPYPGVYWQSSSFYYQASASTTLQIPIAGATQVGLKAEYASETLTGIWVPDFHLGNNLTLAFGASLPIQHLRVQGLRTSADTSDGIGDIMLSPFILGWHDTSGNFLSASLRVFAPTGDYDKNSLANIGMNYWTFTPTLAYTHLDVKNGIDFSVVGGIDVNTKNNATDYTSGAMAHLDATLTKTFENKIGVGVFGSVLYQISDDKGAVADMLNGFRGRSYAIGPMIKYTAGSREAPINLSLNWAPEFGGENRLQGNAVYFNASGKF